MTAIVLMNGNVWFSSVYSSESAVCHVTDINNVQIFCMFKKSKNCKDIRLFFYVGIFQK